MSLPSSENLPNDINDLPPARQRHIRRQPHAASAAERQILLNSLVRLSAPTPNFFLRTLLGAAAVGCAFYLNDPIILIIAVVLLPFNTPLFGLALFANTLHVQHALKSLISLLILFLFSFLAGAVSGSLRAFPEPDRLGLFRFSALYWLDLVILGASVLLSILVLVRKGQIPVSTGVLLSYTLILPFAVLGFGLTSRQTQLWSGALLVSFSNLSLALLLAVLSLLILGFLPKMTLGWILTIALLMVTLAVMRTSLNFSLSDPLQPLTSSPPLTPLVISTHSSTPKSLSTWTPTATSTIPTSTATWTASPSPSITPSETPTPSPQPTAFLGVVDSVLGAIIRESPSLDALVATYANNGDRIEILEQETQPDGSRWLFVRTETGETGWILGALVNTQTPAPTN